MKKEGIEAAYTPDKETLEVGYDLTGDGQPDIDIKIRIGALLRAHWKGAVVTIALGALAAAHSLGWL